MKKERLNAIDYLKAIAILFVIFDHIGIASENIIVYSFVFKMAVPVFMVLSGYTFAMSYAKKTSFKEMYEWSFIKGKILRFLFPAIITCFIIYMFEGEEKNFFEMLFMGNYGPGSYYPGLMLQLLFIFPLLFVFLNNERFIAKLSVIVGINILWEISVWMLQIDMDVYRILIFRYITYIALGILLYKGIRVPRRFLWVAFACGVIYISIIKFLGYKPYIFRNWSDTALPVALYVFPIMYLFFHKLKSFNLTGIVGSALALMGRASYHILLAHLITRIMWMQYGSIELWSVISIRVLASVMIGVVAWECERVSMNFIKYIYAKEKQ